MKMIVGTKFRLKLTLFEFLDQINNKKGIYELKKKRKLPSNFTYSN